MATWQIFGPLMRVPSALLNRLQLIAFDRRGNGAQNTHDAALDATATAWDGSRIQVSLDQPPTGIVPAQLDTTLNWIDRKITIDYEIDPSFDIRPGEGADLSYASEKGSITWYSGAGTSQILISNLLSISVGPTGNLLANKASCYVSMQISAGTQQKERS